MRVCRMYVLLFVLAVALVLTGCGGGGGGSSVAPEDINEPPSLTVVSPTVDPAVLDVRTASFLDVTIRGTDPNGDQLRYVATWDAGSVTPAEGTLPASNTATLKFTPPNYNGTCNLTVSLSDGEESVSRTVHVQVTGVSQPAETGLRIQGITSSPANIQPGQTVNLTAGISNPEGKTLTYGWSSRMGQIGGNGATATWIAPGTAGVYGIYLTVSDGTNTVKAGVSVPVAGPSGGVLGEYFKTGRDRNVVIFKYKAFERIEPNINFNWWDLSPDPAKLDGDGFGARWTGYIKCEQPGAYVFRVHTDDGARMKVMNDAGQWIAIIPNVHDNWKDQVEGAWLPNPTVPLQLDGGKWYPINVEYFEGGGNAFITLYWSVNGSPEQIVPQTVLKPQ